MPPPPRGSRSPTRRTRAERVEFGHAARLSRRTTELDTLSTSDRTAGDVRGIALKAVPADADVPSMIRRLARTLVALGLVIAGLRWVYDSNSWSGPVVLSLTTRHGVHLNDWLTPVLWYAAILVARPRWAQLAIPLPIRLRMRDEQGAVVGVRLRLVPPPIDLRAAHAEDADEDATTTVAA